MCLFYYIRMPINHQTIKVLDIRGPRALTVPRYTHWSTPLVDLIVAKLHKNLISNWKEEFIRRLHEHYLTRFVPLVPSSRRGVLLKYKFWSPRWSLWTCFRQFSTTWPHLAPRGPSLFKYWFWPHPRWSMWSFCNFHLNLTSGFRGEEKNIIVYARSTTPNTQRRTKVEYCNISSEDFMWHKQL